MKAKFYLIAVAFAAMSISANAQGTWKVPAKVEGGENLSVLAGNELPANIANLTVTHTFSHSLGAVVKSDADAPVVTCNNVDYDNKSILQADSTNGQYYFFTPAQSGTLDVATKIGGKKNTFVFEVDPVALEVTVEEILTLSTGGDIKAYSATDGPIVKVVGKKADGSNIDPIPDGIWDNSAPVNPTDANQWVVLSFPVTGGKSYAVGCNGSKFQLVGINYAVNTSIDTVIADGVTTVSGYYNFIGQRLQNAPEKGAYIETYTNGTSRKVIRN
jgi:hypothetical protein